MKKRWSTLAALALVGCSSDEVRIFIYGDVTPSDLQLEVRRGDESKVNESFGFAALPATYVLEDGEDGGGEKITVIVRSGSTMNTERSARLDFSAGRDVFLPIPLCASCIGVECGSGETCVNGACASHNVDEDALPEDEPAQNECGGGGSGGGGGGEPSCTGECFSDEETCGPCPTLPMSMDSFNFNFSITSTEVTRAQYAAYLAKNPAPTSPVEGCEGVGLAPNENCVSTGPYCEGDCDSHPQTCVSWCAASEYCRWAGMELCALQQWEAACQGSTDTTYPYGNTYDAQACNGADKGLAMTQPVGGATCGGSFDGMTDMSGNVAEWVREVGEDSRRYYGGSFMSPEMQLDCTSYFDAGGDSTGRPDIGFRCCQ